MHRKRIILAIILVFILLVAVLLYNQAKQSIQPESTLELIGSKEITLMIGSVYQDPGTTISEAQVSGTINTETAGTYTLTYSYQDQTVKRIIKVVNNKQIVMSLNGSQNTYVKRGQTYIESGCHAVDQDEGNITGRVDVSGEVNAEVTGTYQIVYTVENNDGVICSRKRTVNVVDEGEFAENTTGIPVLMYHFVYTESEMPNEVTTNHILDTTLREELQYLKDNQYYFPSYQELAAYINDEIDLPEKSVILTFDDGEGGFFQYGIPLLEEYQVPATSFIIAGNENAAAIVKDYASEYISFQSHSYAMHQAGGTVGHGGIISAMSKEEIIEDLKNSQAIVQSTEAFAYPFGDTTEAAREAINEVGILCSFTTEYGKVSKGADHTQLPRIRMLGESTLQGYILQIE